MNKTKLSFLLLASFMLLSACSNTPDATVTSKSPENIPTNVTLTPPANTKPQPAVNKLEQAISAGDYLKCKELDDSAQVATCETNLLTGKALSLNDQSWCQKATSPDAKSACQNTFDKQNAKDAPTSSDLDKIISAGDYLNCKTLGSADQITICETNLLTDKALTTDDVSWCDKASSSDAKTACQTSFNKKKQ